MAGLLSPTSGQVAVFGELLHGINRRATYMFQQDALLPWKTVVENLALGLELRGTPAAAARSEAESWLPRLGLGGFGGHYPHALSGGMRKRVSLGQCWIPGPQIVLMDEPFGALDVHTRVRMEGEILRLWMGSGKTVVFVTHDLEEAIALSDEIFLLAAGPGSRVAAHYRVDLPRPRNLLDLRAEPRFHEIYSEIWSVLREEVIRSQERQARDDQDRHAKARNAEA
jgi:NitT/TauT family transport system ATP-binding protein